MGHITVLTITYRRSRALRGYLESLVSADRFSDIDVVILINGIDIESELVLNEYADKYQQIRFIQRESCSKGKARNILMANSQDSDILYFLDDDCQIAQDTFTILMNMTDMNPDIDCFGGPNLNAVADKGFAKAQGYALGDPFGSLWVRDRYRVYGKPRLADEHSLILCNLALRYNVFRQAGLSFDETLICAEENLLIRDLISAGYRCMHVPALCVFHERRKTIGGLCRQVFIYGLGKCQVVQKRTFSVWLMNAGLFSVIFLLLGAFIVPWMRTAFVDMGYFYITLAVIAAIRIAIKVRAIGLFWRLLFIFPVIHFGYGFGFIWGILNFDRQGLDFSKSGHV